MKLKDIKYVFSLLLLFTTGLLYSQFYSGYSQDFGKNRVQYREFNWQYLPYKRFEVYYYKGGKNLAAYILQSADKNLEELEKFFDYEVDGKIQLVAYNKQSEFRQSNVGISNEENLGGVTQIVGSKVFLFYEKDHQALDRQIRKNLSSIMFQQMMFGTQWKDVMKNNSMMTIPSWFEDGIIEYATEKWSPEAEGFVKSGIETGIFDNYNLLNEQQSKYAGLALWKYIADVYGENVIPNILFMTRATRNIESGFNFVLGVSLKSLMSEMKLYYNNYFFQSGKGDFPVSKPLFTSKEKAKFVGEKGLIKKTKRMNKILGELPVKSRESIRYSQIKMSPDQKYIAYVTHEMGQYKIWIYNVATGKAKRIFKREPKLQRMEDLSFPILAWHPMSQALSFVYEYRGRPFLGSYFLMDKTLLEKELFRLDKVIDLQYSDDGKKMVFSAVTKGQTDLYLYQIIGNSQQQLTNDIYDDMHPRFIRNSSAIIFASNRPDDTLRTNTNVELFDLNKDIFVFNLNNHSLEQITQTPDIDESFPFEYFGGRNYTFLADADGIYNRYAAFVDSTISQIDTTIHYRYFTVTEQLSSFNQTPLEYNFNSKNGAYSLLFFKNNRYQWFLNNKSNDEVLMGESGNGNLKNNSNSLVLKIDEESKKGEVDINNYVFDKDAPQSNPNVIIISDKPEPEKESTDSLATEEEVFVLPKPRNYQLNFAVDKISSQANNSFKTEFYQNVTGPNSLYPGLGGLFEVQISDLFENYKMIGGFRLSANFRNNNYAAKYLNLKGRVDKAVSFQRQTQRQITDQSLIKVITNSIKYEWSYPFNELAALKFNINLRNDRLIFLSTDRGNLIIPTYNFNTSGTKLSFVYDNTIDKGLNLLNGTRMKFWIEYNQDLRYPTTEDNAHTDHSSLFIFENKTDLKVVGLDFRQYQPIHKNIIAAIRLAGSASFGNLKLLNYLGGTDNWIGQRVDNETTISQNQPYVYQAMATPVRGFYLNARNGSNFGVINAEIRWPIFQYFIKKPIRSDFLKNFQLTGFTDVGSAWNGVSPYSPENEFNTQVIENNPITIIIDNNREPIIYSYGYGMRSRLLGYFMKIDFAHGIDDGIALPRVIHFSLGKDF